VAAHCIPAVAAIMAAEAMVVEAMEELVDGASIQDGTRAPSVRYITWAISVTATARFIVATTMDISWIAPPVLQHRFVADTGNTENQEAQWKMFVFAMLRSVGL